MYNETKSILKESKYIEYTYSNKIAPPGAYPDLLSNWLLKNVYKRTGKLLILDAEEEII